MPIITLTLSIFSALLFLTASDNTILLLNTEASAAIGWLGFLTGHWIHTDLNHLLWNMAGLTVLGAVIEQHSKSLLTWSLAIGILAVNTLLVSPWSDLKLYCGLSGALNTLLVVALYLVWKETRAAWCVWIFIGALAKIILEMTSGTSIFSQTSWPPYPAAHLAGMLGGLALVMIHTIQSGGGARTSSPFFTDR